MAYMKKATPMKKQKTATPLTERKSMNKVAKPLTKRSTTTASAMSSGAVGKSKLNRKMY